MTYLLGALVDKSIVSVSFPSDEARYDLLDTVRDYALERLAESGGLAAARKAHAEYFATLADAARTGAPRAGLAGLVDAARARERQPVGRPDLRARRARARRRDPAGASLGWYFSLAERVSEGRRFVELALATASDDAPARLRLELLGFLCFLATEELDLDAAIEIGERALALAAAAPPSPEAAQARALLSLALAQSGSQERAAKLAEEARDAAETAGDQWTAGGGQSDRCDGCRGRGRCPNRRHAERQRRRHSEAIEYLPTPAAGNDARSVGRRAARRQRGRDRRIPTRVRAREPNPLRRSRCLCPGQTGLDRARERRAAPGRRAVQARARRRRRGTRALGHRLCACPARPHPRRGWRRRPRREAVPERSGVVGAAAAAPSSESLFLMLAGSPGAAALHALAELADARGDAEAGAELRAHAELASA